MAEQPKNFGFGDDEAMLKDAAAKFFADNATADKIHSQVANHPDVELLLNVATIRVKSGESRPKCVSCSTGYFRRWNNVSDSNGCSNSGAANLDFDTSSSIRRYAEFIQQRDLLNPFVSGQSPDGHAERI